MTTPPLVTQALVCLVALALMVLAGVRKRRLELRGVPPSRRRLRAWLRDHRR